MAVRRFRGGDRDSRPVAQPAADVGRTCDTDRPIPVLGVDCIAEKSSETERRMASLMKTLPPDMAFFVIYNVHCRLMPVLQSYLEGGTATVKSTGERFQIIASHPIASRMEATTLQLYLMSAMGAELASEVAFRPVDDPLQVGGFDRKYLWPITN